MQPTPAHEIPFLVGGVSDAALARVVRHDAGWIAEVKPSQDPVGLIRDGVERICALRTARGDARGTTVPLRIVYNANEPIEVLDARLDALIDAGVTDVAIEVDFTAPREAEEALRIIHGHG